MTQRRAGAPVQLGVFLIDPATGSPLAIVSNSLSINIGRWFGAVTPTVGQKTMAASLPVAIASNQSVIPVIGTEVDGVTITGQLLAIAGVDGSGNARRVLTGTDGVVKARESLVAMTWVAGITTAPAANAVIADTGALAAGDYDFTVAMGLADTTLAAGKCLILEHRNAANAATLFNLALCAQQAYANLELRRYTLAANERLRVINGAVAGLAASRYHGSIGRRLS